MTLPHLSDASVEQRDIRTVLIRPLTDSDSVALRDFGCIGFSSVAKSLRCTLLEIPDRILAKLR
jgi:hypothetical protein